KSSTRTLLTWSGQVDLNHRPHGPEPCALTRLSYAPIGENGAGRRKRDADSRGSASEGQTGHGATRFPAMWDGFSTRPPPEGRPLRGHGRVENPSHMATAESAAGIVRSVSHDQTLHFSALYRCSPAARPAADGTLQGKSRRQSRSSRRRGH